MRRILTPAEALQRHYEERSNMLVLAANQIFDITAQHILTPDLLSVYLAICAHAKREKFTKTLFLGENNAHGKSPANSLHCGDCFPSAHRLAALLGMRKASILDAVDMLEKFQWLDIIKRKIRGGRSTNVYKVKTSWYEKQERPFTVSQSMFFCGVWAFLTPSERLVWLLCRASAWYGGELTGHMDELYEASTGEQFAQSEIWFMPSHRIDIQHWSSIYHITARTIEDAFKSLRQKNFLWYDEGYSEEGIVLRVHPRIPDNYPGWAEHLVKFYGRLDSAQDPEISQSTKKLLNALK